MKQWTALWIAEDMLSKYTDNISWDNFQYDSWYCKALESIITELRSLNSSPASDDSWISLSETYPEDNTYVLASDEFGIEIVIWEASERSWNFIWDSPRKFTEWQPLPKRPYYSN